MYVFDSEKFYKKKKLIPKSKKVKQIKFINLVKIYKIQFSVSRENRSTRDDGSEGNSPRAGTPKAERRSK